MAAKHTNADARLHIDLLRSQCVIFHSVRERMVRAGRTNEARELLIELLDLTELIHQKEKPNH